MSNILFISDLHLTPERPQTMQLFLKFVAEIAARADTLYILGDFLEVWWGDDDSASGYQEVFNALSNLATEQQTHVYLMHGNRDFMIGNALAMRCHFTLIDEPYKLQLAGKKSLLIHGDSLCTDDIEYQKFRDMVRNPLWQQQVLSKTLEERYALAHAIREKSKVNTAMKTKDIMDVNEKATQQLFIDEKIDLLIHGHTHRQAFHHLTINNKPAQRIVLGDWGEHGNYLRVDSNTIEMIDYTGLT